MTKKPQDRLQKRTKPAARKWTTAGDDGEVMNDFTYTSVDGSELVITAEELENVLTPGFVRRNRSASQEEISYLLLESLDREDLLELIDSSWRDYKAFSTGFAEYVNEYMELSMGESLAS